MEKYTFNDLIEVSNEGLDKIKDRMCDRLGELRQKKWNKISSILYLQDEIDRELKK